MEFDRWGSMWCLVVWAPARRNVSSSYSPWKSSSSVHGFSPWSSSFFHQFLFGSSSQSYLMGARWLWLVLNSLIKSSYPIPSGFRMYLARIEAKIRIKFKNRRAKEYIQGNNCQDQNKVKSSFVIFFLISNGNRILKIWYIFFSILLWNKFWKINIKFLFSGFKNGTKLKLIKNGQGKIILVFFFNESKQKRIKSFFVNNRYRNLK